VFVVGRVLENRREELQKPNRLVRSARKRRRIRFQLRNVGARALFSSSRRFSSTRPTTNTIIPSASSLTSSSVAYGHLRLHHPEFREVPPRLRFLRAERRPEAVHFAERHGRSFVIELARLRQIRLLVFEVIDFEQRRVPSQAAGVKIGVFHQREPVGIEVIPHRANDFMPHPQNGVLPLAAKATGCRCPSGSPRRDLWA